MARPDEHEDPNSEGTARVLQMAAMAASVAEALARLSAQRAAERQEADQRGAAAARAQRHADHATARVAWSPAGDPEWLRQAGTLDVGRAWGAAVPWAPTDPSAAAAQDACEERLRDLHPDAMRRYDWLRQDGADPHTAMRDVAPQFAHPSEPHVWPSGPAAARAALTGSLDGLATAERGTAGDERKAAAADLATRDQPATTTIDEAVTGSRGAAGHLHGADAAAQRANHFSRTPAGVAGEGYPLDISQAATPGGRRLTTGSATATRTAARSAPRVQGHTAIQASAPRH